MKKTVHDGEFGPSDGSFLSVCIFIFDELVKNNNHDVGYKFTPSACDHPFVGKINKKKAYEAYRSLYATSETYKYISATYQHHINKIYASVIIEMVRSYMFFWGFFRHFSDIFTNRFWRQTAVSAYRRVQESFQCFSDFY